MAMGTLDLVVGASVEFQSGRHYGPDGQLIAVEVVGLDFDVESDAGIASLSLDDKTRGIKYLMKHYYWGEDSISANAILRLYDAGGHECL